MTQETRTEETSRMKKRYFLGAGAAFLGTALFSRALLGSQSTTAENPETLKGQFEVTKTEAEWRKVLNPEQFYVLRQHGTERAGTSPLDQEYRPGMFACAGCDLPLFQSTTKFNSGTGWPSFYAPIAGAVGTKTDTSFLMTRVEVHCRRCGGHLGHVFDDGPAPTGDRYCMNGVALKFKPTAV
ncbi:peptide-methionine (R)-S-oxide reductase MsrB [Leptolyngbyaceae cyanobacterium UHCC 1019]